MDDPAKDNTSVSQLLYLEFYQMFLLRDVLKIGKCDLMEEL